MTQIADLSADQLAHHALNIFIAQGRHVEGARVIYRALQLDPHHPGALRCLSDFLAHEGTEPFAAATLEHALSGAVPLDDDARRMLDDLRFLDIWSWGFSRHVSGEANLSGEAFQQREDFVFDGPAYAAFLNTVTEPAGSLQGAFQAAIRICGLMSGLLRHAEKDNPAFDDVLRSSAFVETEAYPAWLASPTDDLDALDQAIQAQRQAG
ncbi:hypothetical protein JY419_04950 [Stenotrophomonas maltophilia]|nr:hypothetical protein [Stenotrophomonas maltophilia]